MFAVDLDRKKPKLGEDFHDGIATWAEWVAKEGAVETRTSETPSTGHHLLFRAQDGIRNVPLHRLGPGIEIKGEGGYIIVPPSRHVDGDYRWINTAPIAEAPQWLIDKIFAERKPRRDLTEGLSPERIKDLSQHPEDLLYPPPTRAMVKAALAAIDPDICRADWIAIGCGICHQFGDDGEELWDDWSSKGTKYKAREMEVQWRSIANRNGYHYTIATVFHFANKANPDPHGISGRRHLPPPRPARRGEPHATIPPPATFPRPRTQAAPLDCVTRISFQLLQGRGRNRPSPLRTVGWIVGTDGTVLKMAEDCSATPTSMARLGVVRRRHRIRIRRRSTVAGGAAVGAVLIPSP